LHPEIEPCRLLSAKIEYVTGEIKPFIKKWCGTGTHMHTYDVHGNVYPCQFFMPLSMGREKSEAALGISIPSEIPAEYFGSECATCPLTPVCPTCLGSNYSETGNLYKKSPGFCRLQKSILAANAYLKWRQLKLGTNSLNDSEKYRLLRGIKVIQDYLFTDT
jgi:radical SAM protein with 4Fe4S-binding SPASM domain